MLNEVKLNLQTERDASAVAHRPMHVFVHLAHGFGSELWAKSYDEGRLIGINERFPYGYHRAEGAMCSVTYSADAIERGWQKLGRLAIRAILGFDFVHAWRNRKRMYQADVVWTHTESQHLAVAACLLLGRRRKRPRLIAQSIWLFDAWPRLGFVHRWLFKRLMNRADVLTVHSPENLRRVRSLMPHKRSELVLYGIRSDEICEPTIRADGQRFIRIAALGNDRHRDWATLAEAVRPLECCRLKIVSRTIQKKLISALSNAEVAPIRCNKQLFELYEWADIVVVPLKHNLHASGITVIQEAVLRGVPVVCSKVGGLDAYFSGWQVKYVPPGDPAALRQAILDVAADAEQRVSMVRDAQSAMGPDGLSSLSFVRRHVELSVELLAP